ncbi:uncharacterized protein LOC127749274 [Frankliniella occidentalis]|uniref:Uncharacterized protein LOC127749274 n=1 Tax=Frankliniella occidentalis TaxID=133901 RepID=A0A9C6U2Y3_FRAOC|nr:uncharacterized protein LOC127749274 [Frankliniella occidentalis]
MELRGRWLLLASVVVVVALPAATPLGLLLLSAAQQYQEAVLPFREHPYTGNKPILAEYDFIVVSTDVKVPTSSKISVFLSLLFSLIWSTRRPSRLWYNLKLSKPNETHEPLIEW